MLSRSNLCFVGDVIIVAHAGSLDGLSRQLQGLNPRPMPQFIEIVTKVRQSPRACSRDSAMSDVISLQVPYCGSVVLEDSKDDAKVWRLIEPPYPSLIHAPKPHFDWKALND